MHDGATQHRPRVEGEQRGQEPEIGHHLGLRLDEDPARIRVALIRPRIFIVSSSGNDLRLPSCCFYLRQRLRDQGAVHCDRSAPDGQAGSRHSAVPHPALIPGAVCTNPGGLRLARIPPSAIVLRQRWADPVRRHRSTNRNRSNAIPVARTIFLRSAAQLLSQSTTS
jgi:hypothetical protein